MTRQPDRREKVFYRSLPSVKLASLHSDHGLPVHPDPVRNPGALPKALMEIERDRMQGPVGVSLPRIRLSVRAVLTLFIVLVLVFFGTPRGLMGGGLRAPNVGGGSGNLLDDMLDPSFGGRANSGKMLMQVNGENVGYLRMFTLSDFRDGVWRAEKRLRRGGVRSPHPEMSTISSIAPCA